MVIIKYEHATIEQFAKLFKYSMTSPEGKSHIKSTDLGSVVIGTGPTADNDIFLKEGDMIVYDKHLAVVYRRVLPDES